MILIFGSVILNKVLCASVKILDSIFEGTVDKSTKLNAMHIFQDGNGRTGRMIMHQQLLNQGLLPAVIKDQSKYRQAFRRYDKNGEIALMEYVIAEGILETYHRLEKINEKFLDR